jgi:hypothetical protein
VLADGERRLLRNGHHRLFAAWRSGLRTVPCVVVEGEAAALASRIGDGFPAAALGGERPPRFADLADGGPACVDVELRPKRYTLHLRAEREVVYDLQ